MRPSDLVDWWRLRRLTENAWQVVRFRKQGKRAGAHDLLVRLRDGHRIELRAGQSDQHVFSRIYVRDEYRLSGLAAGGWETVVDLGANVGIFAARAAGISRRVICYEPSAANLAQLERNLRGFPGIEAVGEAVAAAPGVVKLYRPGDGRDSYCFTLHPEPGIFAQDFDAFDEVRATTLDALFERHEVTRCDLLKIDVEGSEYEILHAASDDTLGRVRRLHAEYHDVRPDDPRTRIGNLVAHLESKGFAVELAPSPSRPNHGLLYARRA